jgi:outer membrane lipopolysaccharide assembly protein LptE/RlpB
MRRITTISITSISIPSIMLILLLAVLAGCGFRLAVPQALPKSVQQLYLVQTQQYVPEQVLLRRLLQRYGVQLLPKASDKALRLELAAPVFHQELVASDAAGNHQISRLTLTLTYQVWRGKRSFPAPAIVLSRECSYQTAAGSITSMQLQQIQQELLTEGVQRLLRALYVVSYS